MSGVWRCAETARYGRAQAEARTWAEATTREAAPRNAEATTQEARPRNAEATIRVVLPTRAEATIRVELLRTGAEPTIPAKALGASRRGVAPDGAHLKS